MAFSVLVVEDDPAWSQALCKMYEEILAKDDPKVQAASNVPNARRNLESQQFDLLSLDINMSGTYPEEGDGRTLVRKAEELNAVGGLVVITGIAHDEELDVIMPEEEIASTRATLTLYLDSYFPGNHLYFPKPEDTPVDESVQIIRDNLTRRRLHRKCGAQNVFRREGSLWQVQYAGKEVRLEDRKGMKSIYYLLQQASKNEPDVSDRDLDQYENASAGGASMSKGQMAEEQMAETTGDGYDLELKRKDRKRLREIDEELERVEKRLGKIEGRFEEIEEDVSAELISPPQDEIDSLGEETEDLKEKRKKLREEQKELRKRGEPREVKQRRQRVSRRISRSIEQIRTVHPELAKHLDEAVDTGKTCSYKSREPIKWSF